MTTVTSTAAGGTAFRRDPAGVSLRRLKWADRAAVLRLHRSMTERDAYLRFFAPLPSNIDGLLDVLCQQDQTRGVAIGAFRGSILIGVGNYVVLHDDPARSPDGVHAEIALIVAHGAQHRGVGTALLRAVAEAAYRNGVSWLHGEILAENSLLLRVLAEQHLDKSVVRNGATAHLAIDLDAYVRGDGTATVASDNQSIASAGAVPVVRRGAS